MKRYMIWNMGSLGWGFRFGISARGAPVQTFKGQRFKDRFTERRFQSFKTFADLQSVAMNLIKSMLMFFLVGSLCGSSGFAQTTNLRIAFNGYGRTMPLFLGQDAGDIQEAEFAVGDDFYPRRLVVVAGIDRQESGVVVVLDVAAKENPKAKALTVQQVVDLRYLQ